MRSLYKSVLTLYSRGSRVLAFLFLALLAAALLYGVKSMRENYLLRKVIERLSADSRIAEVVVTDVRYDAASGKAFTTIKFLEYDAHLKPLAPKHFTFSGNLIQFQSMVIRFDDFYVKRGHPLKGKSAYVFMKAFALNDNGAEAFTINRVNEIPTGYDVQDGCANNFEKKLWQRFWQYALNPDAAKRIGIKNAQIEAPGTQFVKGMLYTIKIEHDGGMRIDAKQLPLILKGEQMHF